MSFVTWAALAIGAFVMAPLLAHLLRRRPPRRRPFAAAHLVPASAAETKRRRALEDRALFGLRALAIVALALLGATPLLRCDRLSVTRQSGASVALAVVLDDSLSMRAGSGAAADPSRFERAKEAAVELVEGLRSGDVVGVVLAGKPARVALAATTNLATAAQVLRDVAQADRGTDLDGALVQAQELLQDLPHGDRRVVLLSDLLDAGKGGDLAVQEGLRLWAPLETMREPRPDCAVVRADWVRGKVLARVACGPRSSPRDGAGAEPDGGAEPVGSAGEPTAPGTARAEAGPRTVVVRRGDRELGRSSFAGADGTTDVVVSVEPEMAGSQPPPADGGVSAAPGDAASATAEPELPGRRAEPQPHAYVLLEGSDAIEVDDRAPVLEPSSSLRIGIVADAEAARPPTGGPPPVEQALAALGHAGRLTLLTSVPDEDDLLEPLSLLVIDDAPGFAPEERRRLASWVERGGVLVLSLGPRAGAARLGSGFEPILPAVVRWSAWEPAEPAASAGRPDAGSARAGGVRGAAAPAAAAGIDPASDDWFGETAAGLARLAATGRAELELTRGQQVRVRARWSDGEPFVVERRSGRGVVYGITLPLDADVSDFPLRPAFLLMLEQVIDTARTLGGVARSPVGTPWLVPADAEVSAAWISPQGEVEPLELEPFADQRRLVAERLGLYRLTIDGTTTHRVAAPDEEEVVGRPRRLSAGAEDPELGGTSASVDVSRYVAWVLLVLLAGELVLRAVARRREA